MTRRLRQARAGVNIGIKDAWHGVRGSAERHRFKGRLMMCEDEAACKFFCDSTSACGNPAPEDAKTCQVVYVCSDKP